MIRTLPRIVHLYTSHYLCSRRRLGLRRQADRPYEDDWVKPVDVQWLLAAAPGFQISIRVSVRNGARLQIVTSISQTSGTRIRGHGRMVKHNRR